jgi:hypothetical protein
MTDKNNPWMHEYKGWKYTLDDSRGSTRRYILYSPENVVKGFTSKKTMLEYVDDMEMGKLIRDSDSMITQDMIMVKARRTGGAYFTKLMEELIAQKEFIQADNIPQGSYNYNSDLYYHYIVRPVGESWRGARLRDLSEYNRLTAYQVNLANYINEEEDDDIYGRSFGYRFSNYSKFISFQEKQEQDLLYGTSDDEVKARGVLKGIIEERLKDWISVGRDKK